jgi:hypothetical protein
MHFGFFQDNPGSVCWYEKAAIFRRQQKQWFCCIMSSWIIGVQGWPELKGSFAVQAGDEVVVTTDENAQASASCLPITYKQFASICQPRDQLFIGRYLANGSDTSSLYLEVCSCTIITYMYAPSRCSYDVMRSSAGNAAQTDLYLIGFQGRVIPAQQQVMQFKYWWLRAVAAQQKLMSSSCWWLTQGGLHRQVKEVRGGDVVCKAINDAVLEGMLTVIHSQAAVDGMSHWQVYTRRR